MEDDSNRDFSLNEILETNTESNESYSEDSKQNSEDFTVLNFQDEGVMPKMVRKSSPQPQRKKKPLKRQKVVNRSKRLEDAVSNRLINSIHASISTRMSHQSQFLYSADQSEISNFLQQKAQEFHRALNARKAIKNKQKRTKKRNKDWANRSEKILSNQTKAEIKRLEYSYFVEKNSKINRVQSKIELNRKRIIKEKKLAKERKIRERNQESQTHKNNILDNIRNYYDHKISQVRGEKENEKHRKKMNNIEVRKFFSEMKEQKRKEKQNKIQSTLNKLRRKSEKLESMIERILLQHKIYK